MAARKFHHDQKPSRFLYLGSGGQKITPVEYSDDTFELNESDLWNSGGADDHHLSNDPQNPSSKRSKFPLKLPHHHHHQQRKGFIPTATAKSMPVNVPDWSKILRDEYKDHERRENDDNDDDDEDDDENERLPPHEYLARTRIASFSVHEGVGRTLKGRDLSRVRNAIWKQTGFEQD